MTAPDQQTHEASRQSDAELSSQAEALTRFNHSAAGRELRILNLEQEVNALCQRQGEAARYPLKIERDTKLTQAESLGLPSGDSLMPLAQALAASPHAAPGMLEEAVQARQAMEKLNAELRESEERYRLLFESLEEGYCVIEKVGGEAGELLDFRYVETNLAFAAQTGLGGVLGKTLRQVLPDEFEERIRTYDAVRRTGEAVRFQREFATHGRVLELYAFRVADQAQGRVAINLQDITERKQAERLLRESEAFSRSILKSSPDCINVLDLEGNLLSMLSGQELLGIEDIRPFLNKCWFDFWAGQDKLAARMAVESAVAGGVGNFVGFFRTLRGEPKWWDVAISPIPGADGTTARLLAVSRDVTERQHADEALRRSEERFRALFDRGPIAIYSCDPSGVIQEYNACAVKLWGQEPKPGDTYKWFRSSLRFFLPDGTLLTGARSPMGKVLRGDIPSVHDQEFIFERSDGSRITIIANIVPLKNEQGQITGAINCFYDITERNRLQQATLEQARALAELDRRKDEFLAMLSHELRNPLAALSNAVQLLRLQKSEAPLQQQARHVIERQLGQLKHLVDDLLEVSRISTGRVQLRQERVSVGGIVERAVETAQPLIAQHRHQLTVSLPPEPIFLRADAARLEQVLVNLLTNAAKYTDEGGRIWLSVEHEDAAARKMDGAAAAPMVVIRVRDTGIGIAPELLPRIFDLFTQAERSIDRSQGGLGIGLCLVQRLVELHGGTVAAYSAMGQGSEFVVRLPAMLTALRAMSLPALETAQPPEKGCRVLVVDDNVDAAQSLAMLLKLFGHEVEIAYDGPTGLEAALAMRPDVVLLDIGLPGLTGFEVAEQIRQQPTLKNTVLVALTGYGQESDRQHSQEAGFDHHLVKPTDFAELQKILASVAERAA